jgi:DNA polymerase
MSWTPQQTEMLQAMGLRLWAPAQRPPTGVAEAPVEGVRTAAAPARTAVPAVRPAPAPVMPPPAPARSPSAPALPPPAPQPERSSKLPVLSTLNWDALRETVAACRACGLCESRRQTVFGTGHAQAHWMVVGEAPGEQEDLQGEPFVGASGQLLDRMLQALNLTRAADGPEPPAQRVFIANTLKCRPPRNRNPTAAEMAQCEPYLVRQIELLQPRLILAMGRFAVQALLRSDEPIGKLRGRVHRYQGVPLVVTYHPAYLLRNLADKARAWDDLCLAAQVAEAGAPG